MQGNSMEVGGGFEENQRRNGEEEGEKGIDIS